MDHGPGGQLRSTVRSNVAKAQDLTEETVNDLLDYAGNKRLSEREKAALHYPHRATRPVKACSQPEQPLPEHHGWWETRAIR